MSVRIARFHNIFGPEGTWSGGREKAPAAICRKIAEAEDGSEIVIWGDGKQTRSFLYIDECIDGVRRLMKSDCSGPLNIGSSEMVTINALIGMISEVAGKSVRVRHVEGPIGVRGRTSDNSLIQSELGWSPSASLMSGLRITYRWIDEQVAQRRAAALEAAAL
jgi:nucleoside-diphosphate-sugar epimerase